MHRDGAELSLPQWLAAGLAVFEQCCTISQEEGGTNETVQVLVVDPDSGRASSSRSLPHVSDFAFDRSGRHLAYVTVDESGAGGDLVIEAAGESPRPLGSGYLAVAWAG